MKAININTSKSMQSSLVDLSDRQPCWYANLENGTDRKKAKWIIGVKNSDENKNEHSFKLSNAGDVYDDEFWNYSSSADFAAKIIDLFRNGGETSVDSWIKNGCM